MSAAAIVVLFIVLAVSTVLLVGQQRKTSDSLARERWLRGELAVANERLAAQQRQTMNALERKTADLEMTSEDLLRERRASYLQRIALAAAALELAGDRTRFVKLHLALTSTP